MSRPFHSGPAERRAIPSPTRRPKDVFHQKRRLTREMLLTLIGLGVTIVAAAFLARDGMRMIRAAMSHGLSMQATQQTAFMLIFLFLVYGNVLYQWTRVGYFRRLRAHRRAPDGELGRLFLDDAPPSVTMLIPSYREEIHVIRQSVLSCALQDYPDKRVVLLIDDKPDPENPADILALLNARNIAEEIGKLFAAPLEEQRTRHAAFLARPPALSEERRSEDRRHLRAAIERAAVWFEENARIYPATTHGDRLFVELTFDRRAATLRRQQAEIELELAGLSDEAHAERIDSWYRRLSATFSAEISTFERKRYEDLSHAPNKAMNLNSYISLMGRWLRIDERTDGVHLVDENPEEPSSWYVHEPDFILTLDADSVLEHDYALRLIDHACRPENARVAVVQTPYSAVPEPTSVLERIAGATTDMQYIVHQGFTSCDATFWVGANAVLRKRALDDIAAVDVERGHPVMRYIHDRTVIEDTESSIDLVCKGWKLHNYPERLSYSATPPDFGSLVVQRCRWANGGLIILPKLLAFLRARPRPSRFPEAFMRFHYLASIAGVNLGVLLILVFPASDYMKVAWLPLTALPYYVLYARDLRQAGYRLSDAVRVYALNLLLIPVNLAGVWKSLRQMVTGRTIPFGRTPKIADRTATPRAFVAAEYLFAAYCLLGTVIEAWNGRWLNAGFALFNGALLVYGIVAFMGARESWRDLRGHAGPAGRSARLVPPIPPREPRAIRT